MIRISRLTKNYGSTCALDNVDLNIEKGKFTAIMGPSGSGKSTMLNIIGLLDEKTSGEIYIEGELIDKLDEKQMALMRMKTFGFIFQNFYLNNNMTAVDNIVIAMEINDEYKKVDKVAVAKDMLKRFGLEEYADKRPTQMSGGEQQRVCIARALINNPKIILADEPTGNLDKDNEEKVFDELKKLANQGITVIVVSHNDNVKNYADRVVVFNKGGIQSDEA